MKAERIRFVRTGTGLDLSRLVQLLRMIGVNSDLGHQLYRSHLCGNRLESRKGDWLVDVRETVSFEVSQDLCTQGFSHTPCSLSRIRGKISLPKKVISSMSGQPINRNCEMPTSRYFIIAPATSSAPPTMAIAGEPR